MKPVTRFFALLIPSMLVIGCSKGHEAKTVGAAAEVDDNVISQAAVAAAVPTENVALRAAKLETFIAEQLMANAAVKDKLELEPANATALETARRQALARAYVHKLAAGIAKPSPDQIGAYYQGHPELFAQRRIYRLQEIVIKGAPIQLDEANQRLRMLRTFNDRLDELKKMGIPFTTGANVKAAEDLPADLLLTLAQLGDGAAVTVPGPGSAMMLQIVGIESRPLSQADAGPAIERFLLNEKLGEMINQETKRLRSAAHIAYVAPYSAPKPQ